MTNDGPRDVQIKIDVVKLGEIDTMNEKFTCEVLIESSWLEPKTDITAYDANKYWNPKLYIKNVLNDPKEQIKYDMTLENSILRITETKTCKAQFWERLELYDFPFDLQQLNIIVSTKLKANEINIVSETDCYFLLNRDAKRTFLDQQKWKLLDIVKLSDSIQKKNMSPNTKVTPVNSDVKIDIKKSKKSPKLIATCFCSRHPEFYLFNAFFLIFLITASSLTVFSISKSLPTNRLPTTFTILLSSISFKWVVNRSLPPVAYLTFLDKYSIVCILFINVLGAWHSIIGSFYSYWPQDVDFWMMITFVIIFILIHIFCIVWYMIITRRMRFFQKEERLFVREYLKKNNLLTLFDIEEDEKDDIDEENE